MRLVLGGSLSSPPPTPLSIVERDFKRKERKWGDFLSAPLCSDKMLRFLVSAKQQDNLGKHRGVKGGGEASLSWCLGKCPFWITNGRGHAGGSTLVVVVKTITILISALSLYPPSFHKQNYNHMYLMDEARRYSAPPF